MILRRLVIGSILMVSILFIAVASVGAKPQDKVLAIKVNGVINPVSSEFIIKSIDKSLEINASALVIELDTPGGLDTSMRDIIKSMLASPVPVVVYVSPSGARAASAGTFITIAAHVAAMSPQTNIGAAHPVGVGEKMDKTLSDKATNDAAAYIKSLAEKRGRNYSWAEDAVRKSDSITESEALSMKVIDIVSPDLKTLLKEIDGREVETTAGRITLKTEGAEIVRSEMGLRQRILDIISNPNVAYMLMLLGFYGLFFELTNPGAVFPGVIGGICLLLAFFAFQTLPVNYAGLLLILLAVVLFILETQIASYGALAIGGIIAMVLGSIMLFESSAPFLKLSISIIITSVVITLLFFTIVLRLIMKAHRRKPQTGAEGLIDMEGTAATDIDAHGGMATVHGEKWSATSDEHIAKGEKVYVVSVYELKIKVKKENQ